MQIQSRTQKFRIIYVQNEYQALNPFFPADICEDYEPITEEINFLHYHNDLEIGFCYSGSGVFFINNHVIPYQGPCISIIYPGQAHIAQSRTKPNRWQFINIDTSLLFSNNEEMIKYNYDQEYFVGKHIFNESEDKSLVELTKSFIEELKNKEENYIDCAKNLVYSILIKHFRYNEALPNAKEITRTLLHEIAPAVSYITNYYYEQITVEELAKLCNLSTTSLRRQFHVAMNMSPMEYLHKVRINTAIALMNAENMSILDVGSEVGYNSQSSFNRQFLKITGKSPIQMKKSK